MVSPQAAHVDGKVWTQNNGFAGVHRLDLRPRRSRPGSRSRRRPRASRHNIYDVIPDSKNNAYFTDFRQHHIGRIDAVTAR